jgi:hypothetical protein
VSIATTTTIASGFTAPVTTKQSLLDLKTLDLGTLTSGARTKNDRIVYTLTFFERKAFSEVPGATVADNRFVATGETQVITVSFVDSVIPIVVSQVLTVTSPTAISVALTLSESATVYWSLVDQVASAVVPTANELIAQSLTSQTGFISKGVISNSATPDTGTITTTASKTYKLYFVALTASGKISMIRTVDIVTPAQ